MAEMAMAEIYPEQLWSPSDRYVSENRQGVMCLIRLESRPPLTRSDYEFIDEHIDGMREYLVWHFECLRAFVLESANRGVGLISL
jgi:hypothetical protein